MITLGSLQISYNTCDSCNLPNEVITRNGKYLCGECAFKAYSYVQLLTEKFEDLQQENKSLKTPIEEL